MTVFGVQYSSNHAHARPQDVEAMGRQRCGGATRRRVRARQGVLSFGAGEKFETGKVGMTTVALWHGTFPRTCTFRRRHLRPLAQSSHGVIRVDLQIYVVTREEGRL